MADEVERLTERQKECLRLVLQHYQTKEIARELNITPFAVKARLRSAMAVLGISDRFAAARLLAQAEAYPWRTYPSRLVDPDAFVTLSPTSDEIVGHASLTGAALQEDQRPFGGPFPERRVEGDRSRPSGGRNELNIWQRLGWIAAVAIGVALAFGGIIAGLKALSELL